MSDLLRQPNLIQSHAQCSVQKHLEIHKKSINYLQGKISVTEIWKMTTTVLIILFILFLLGSGFFSGSETALFSLSRARLLAWKDDELTSRKRAAFLMGATYNKTLIALILGNMFVNSGLSMAGQCQGTATWYRKSYYYEWIKFADTRGFLFPECSGAFLHD